MGLDLRILNLQSVRARWYEVAIHRLRGCICSVMRRVMQIWEHPVGVGMDRDWGHC